jgi:hypothetical protein
MSFTYLGKPEASRQAFLGVIVGDNDVREKWFMPPPVIEIPQRGQHSDWAASNYVAH